MKKIYAISALFVVLITVMIAVGCKNRSFGFNPPNIRHNDQEVIIFMRAIVQNGEKRLAMYDTNDSIAINDLVTTVQPGTTVIWMPELNSRIKKINKILPHHGKGSIFHENPQQLENGKKFKHKVPGNVPPGTEEKYNIEFVYEDDSVVTIDPFIRVPPPPLN